MRYGRVSFQFVRQTHEICLASVREYGLAIKYVQGIKPNSLFLSENVQQPGIEY